MEGKRDIRGSNITLIKKNHIKIMPQLTPFYFVNEVTFAFAIILITIYMLSKYILPRFVRLFLARTFISKLFN
jgi:F-type H+-transporting ATPase subunit 8